MDCVLCKYPKEVHCGIVMFVVRTNKCNGLAMCLLASVSVSVRLVPSTVKPLKVKLLKSFW